jgi:twitching motility two-component system response regulator PilH
MKKRVDPLGRLLLRSGVLSEDALADVLDHQRHTLPIASLSYVLGLAEEESLVRVLSKQRGVPGVVVDRSVISTRTLGSVPLDVCLRHGILPLYEDPARLFVAMQDPSDTAILRELAFIRGKAVVPHVGLHVTIARALRLAAAALARGEPFWYGPRAVGREAPDSHGRMAVVSDVDQISGEHRAAPPPVRVDSDYQELTDITRELYEEEASSEAPTGGIEEVTSSEAGSTLDTPVAQTKSQVTTTDASGSLQSQIEIVPTPTSGVIDLDIDLAARPAARPAGPTRVLIVDDDFATRHLLVKTLTPAGYVTDTAASGMEAVKRLRAVAPDVVIIDIMLPEIDGFQICRSIKTSRKYRHIPVILISAVIDSGRVTEEVLVRYGADAYFEKPINVEKLRRRLKELHQATVTPPASPEDESFERALELYRQGQMSEAIDMLRAGLEVDPLSTKHHFVLANLLQKQNLLYEAIDEYEATVNLKPDYFPALSRLAYLYYKKGFSAKAIETWRRSLPHCPDQTLRANIEAFMRKLIAEMQSEK